MGSPSDLDGYVVGVDIGGTNLRLALADRQGIIAAKWAASTAGIRDPNLVVDLIRQGVEELSVKAAVPQGKLHAIGIGAPGITNVDDGVVIATSYLLGWRDVPLRELIEGAVGIPAAIDNDVNLAAIGESWVGAARGTSDFVFLAIGTGVGAGIVLDGRPLRGAGWAAGEIGYLLLPGMPDTPPERGKPGSLEGVLGGEGVKAQWRAGWTETNTDLPRDLSATEIFDHAVEGDPLAATILDQAARMLASVIYNVSLVLNCPLFVLGGGVGTHPALGEAAGRVLERWGTRVRPKLARSSLGADAQLMGAIRLALDTAQFQ